MDYDDPEVQRLFFALHDGLPREGPGSRACTARALAMAGALPAAPRILDIACGPGMQTMDLAALLPHAGIVALDNHAPFLAELERRAVERGVDGRVATLRADMAAIPCPPGSFDLIWCEGAAYIIGVETALRAWRPLLKPGGKLALSEAVWLRPDPPEELRRWWSAGYPAMGDVETCRRRVRDCGYILLGDFVLPESAWWDEYYEPLQARLAQLSTYAGHALWDAIAQDHRTEIETYRRYAAYYGYVFLVMQAGDAGASASP
ncbi:MAG: class I SAM-dependent methyltransferase [Dongiaceae bacterium]